MALHILQLGPYPPPEGGISPNMLAIRDKVLASGASVFYPCHVKSSRVGAEPDVYHPRSPFALIEIASS